MSSEKPKSKPTAGHGDGNRRGRGDSAPRRESPVTNNNSGRVKFDDRGNAVWEWAVSTGGFATDVSSARLNKLSNVALGLVEDAPPPSPLVKQNTKGLDHGYSPYDSGLLAKKPPPRKKDLRRLSEWLKLKKQASENKKDDE